MPLPRSSEHACWLHCLRRPRWMSSSRGTFPVIDDRFPFASFPETSQPNGVVNGNGRSTRPLTAREQDLAGRGDLPGLRGRRAHASTTPTSKMTPNLGRRFTYSNLFSTVHSLTVADVNGSTLKIHQISDTGSYLDRFHRHEVIGVTDAPHINNLAGILRISWESRENSTIIS